MVIASIENLLAPPLAESLAVSCQSWLGNEPTEVSSNLMRVLFSFIRMVSKPKLSLLTQSRPMQALPWTIRSSAITWSAAVIAVDAPVALPLAARVSVCPATIAAPSLTMKKPDSTPPSGVAVAPRSPTAAEVRPSSRAALLFAKAAPSIRGVTRISQA